MEHGALEDGQQTDFFFFLACTVQPVSSRAGYAAGVLVCIGLLAFALYLQYVEQQEPCPLCILQRIAFFAMMAVFVIAALHGPHRRGAFVYSTIAFLFAVAGAGSRGAARVASASSGGSRFRLAVLASNTCWSAFRCAKRSAKCLPATGECAEVGWTFLGLSIAGWSLVWFVLLGVFAIVIAVRAPRARTAW